MEIYVRLAESLTLSGKTGEAAATARQGLQTAELVYGAFAPGHPFVATLRKALR